MVGAHRGSVRTSEARIYLSAVSPTMFVVPIIAAAVLALALYVYILADDKRWLVVAIISHILLFLKVTKGVGETPPLGPAEIVFSLIFFPGLLLWFVRRFQARERFVEGWEDIVTIVFMVYAFLGIGISVYQGFSLQKGFREFLLFVPLLFIFPVRKEAAKKNGRELIIWALLLLSASVAAYIVARYRLDLLVAKYLWQVAANRQQKEESLYMTAIVILFAFLVGNRYRKTIILPLLALELFALAITFSRGYWITTALGIVSLVFLLRGVARRRLIVFSGLAISLAVVVALAVFPRLFVSVIAGLGERMSSISINTLSLRDRLVESQAVIGKVEASPVIGYGLGALFSFFDVIHHMTIETWYIHNAYLFLLFKFGAIGFLLFLSMYLKRVSTLFKLWRRTQNTPDNPLVSAILLIPLMMLFISVTSPQFDDRGSLLILAIVWGIGESMWKNRTD